MRKGEPRTESRRRLKSESACTACCLRRRERRARGEREEDANMDSISGVELGEGGRLLNAFMCDSEFAPKSL